MWNEKVFVKIWAKVRKFRLLQGEMMMMALIRGWEKIKQETLAERQCNLNGRPVWEKRFLALFSLHQKHLWAQVVQLDPSQLWYKPTMGGDAQVPIPKPIVSSVFLKGRKKDGIPT